MLLEHLWKRVQYAVLYSYLRSFIIFLNSFDSKYLQKFPFWFSEKGFALFLDIILLYILFCAEFVGWSIFFFVLNSAASVIKYCFEQTKNDFEKTCSCGSWWRSGGTVYPLWIDGLLNWFEPVYCVGMPAEGAGGGQERLLAPRSGGGQQGWPGPSDTQGDLPGWYTTINWRIRFFPSLVTQQNFLK